jgi:hypothetical protein
VDIEVRPQQLEKEAIPKLAMGIIPCLNDFYVSAAWKIIKPIEEDFVKKCLEEYSLLEVWSKIFYGQAFLYMGYLDPSGKVTEEMSQAFVIDKLANNPKENWVGFVLLRLDPNGMFLWQVWIEPQYRGTTVLTGGLEWLKKLSRDRGCPYLGGASYLENVDQDVAEIAKKLGFTQTYTVFRMSLKE